MTFKEWHDNEANRDALRTLLQHPSSRILHDAFAVIRREATPTYEGTQAVTTARTAADAAFGLATAHSVFAGMNRSIDWLLRDLCNPPPVKKKIEQVQEFDHVLPTLTASPVTATATL